MVTNLAGKGSQRAAQEPHASVGVMAGTAALHQTRPAMQVGNSLRTGPAG
jgi:hypothetical protein